VDLSRNTLVNLQLLTK